MQLSLSFIISLTGHIFDDLRLFIFYSPFVAVHYYYKLLLLLILQAF